jgi:hypothetical protein
MERYYVCAEAGMFYVWSRESGLKVSQGYYTADYPRQIADKLNFQYDMK